MAILAAWDNDEKTIIRHDFDAAWSWDEFWELVRLNSAMVESVSPKDVDIIVNLGKSMTPRGGLTMSNLRKARLSALPNQGIVVVVATPFMKALLSVFISFDPEMSEKLFIVETLEEARRMISERRSPRISEATATL